jgi:glucose/arabinose dehydrogenase
VAIHRINFDNLEVSSLQRFEFDQRNGTTVIGNPHPQVTLSRPTGIVLDKDGYLFIVSQQNSRIIGESSTGFRCIAGCENFVLGGSSKNFNNPRRLAFDSSGNLYVSEGANARIVRFPMAVNACGKVSS